MLSRKFKAGKSMKYPVNYLEMSAGGPFLMMCAEFSGRSAKCTVENGVDKKSGKETRGRLVMGGEALRTGNRVF